MVSAILVAGAVCAPLLAALWLRERDMRRRAERRLQYVRGADRPQLRIYRGPTADELDDGDRKELRIWTRG